MISGNHDTLVYRLVQMVVTSGVSIDIMKGDAMADLADVDICQLTPDVLASGVSLLESHPLRAMDALNVACAPAVAPDMFVSADHRQHSAARKAGLKIVDVS